MIEVHFSKKNSVLPHGSNILEICDKQFAQVFVFVLFFVHSYTTISNRSTMKGRDRKLTMNKNTYKYEYRCKLFPDNYLHIAIC